jgi:hypothetical protein
MSANVAALDEYELRTLVADLADLERDTTLHWLLAQETDAGANAWFAERDARGDTSGFLADVELAWQRAEATGELALQCRYAALSAGFADLAASITPSLSDAFVRSGIWTRAQALAYGGRARATARLDVTLAALAAATDAEQRDALAAEAIEIAARVSDDVEAIGDVIVKLAEALPRLWLTAVLRLVEDAKDEHYRVTALRSVIPRIDAEHLADVERLARDVSAPAERGDLLLLVAERRPDAAESLAREAVSVARAAEDPAAALATLIPRLADAVVADIVDDLAEIDGSADLLLTLIARWARERPAWADKQLRDWGENYSRAFSDARRAVAIGYARRGEVDAAFAIVEQESEFARAEILEALAALVPPSAHARLVAEAERLDEHQRSSALVGICEAHNSELSALALAAARRMTDPLTLPTTLARIAPLLPEALRDEGIAAALDAVEARNSAQALEELAPLLPLELLPRALAVEREARFAPWEGRGAGKLAARLAELGEPREALASLSSIEEPQGRAEALAFLAGHLPAPLLREARTQLEPDPLVDERVALGRALAPWAGSEHNHATLALVRRQRYASRRARSLAALAPFVDDRDAAVREALTELGVIKHDRPAAVQAIAPILSPGLAEPAVAATEKVSELLTFAQALGPQAGAAAWEAIIGRALDENVELLARLPPLPEAAREAVVRRLDDAPDSVASEAIVAAGEDLAGDPRALARAWRIDDLGQRVWAVGALLGAVDPDERQAAVDRLYAELPLGAATIESHLWALSLGEHDRSTNAGARLANALTYARSCAGARERAFALATLATVVPDAVEPALEAAAILDAEDLRDLAPILTQNLPAAHLPAVVALLTERLEPTLGDACTLDSAALRAADTGDHVTAAAAARPLLEHDLDDLLGRLAPRLGLDAIRELAPLCSELEQHAALAIRFAELEAPDDALAAARAAVERYERGSTNLSAPAAPFPRLAELLGGRPDLLKLARRLDARHRGAALAAVLPQADPELQRRELEAALGEGDPRILAPLAPLLPELGADVLAAGVARCLRAGAEQGRRELFERIGALAPAVAAASGAAVIGLIHDELDRVARWWAPSERETAAATLPRTSLTYALGSKGVDSGSVR